MNIVRKFIASNKKISRLAEGKFHKLFIETPSFQRELIEGITASINKGASKVLEVGGIDRPLLEKNCGYKYDGIDIEANENCYEIYDNFYVQSIENKIKDKYDLIISRTLLEHVPNNSESINSIYLALNSGGETHHYIPSKWHPYAIALRLVGPTLQRKLIPILRHQYKDETGYPAYFDHCSISSMKASLSKQGFKDINIKAYYRANEYFDFFSPIFIAVSLFENFCRTLKLETFASGFIISAKKT